LNSFESKFKLFPTGDNFSPTFEFGEQGKSSPVGRGADGVDAMA
jgi:hypothetical protein